MNWSQSWYASVLLQISQKLSLSWLVPWCSWWRQASAGATNCESLWQSCNHVWAQSSKWKHISGTWKSFQLQRNQPLFVSLIRKEYGFTPDIREKNNQFYKLLYPAGKICWFYFFFFFLIWKSNFFRWWFQGPQEDCAETEMWKHSDSEEDLCSQREDGSDRNYSSGITTCMNPQFRMTSE